MHSPGMPIQLSQVLVHCGEPMVPLMQGGTTCEPAPGYSTWRCLCGFQQDAAIRAQQDARASADSAALLTAFSRVERLRWDLDTAMFDLQLMIEEALGRGASPAEVAAILDCDPGEVHGLAAS